MKKSSIIALITSLALTLAAFTNAPEKWVSSKSHVKFFSSTPAEDIEANNFTTVSTINLKTGEVVFSIPMQSFEFEKSLMQKHFNQDKFLDTKQFPKAKFIGKITNIEDINWDSDGTYSATISGDLTIKGVAKSYSETGSIIVSEGTIKANSTFNVTLSDHGIAFEDGKPSTNIAKTVEVTLRVEYQPQ